MSLRPMIFFFSGMAMSPEPFGALAREFDKDPRPPDGGVVGFAHLRREGADQIDMRALLQPGPAHQRLLGQGRAGHDVSLTNGALQILGDDRLDTSGGQRERGCDGARARAVPQRHALDRSDRAVRAHEMGRERPRTHHDEMRGVLAREVARRERRCGCCSPQRERGAVHHRQRLAGVAGHEDVAAVDRRLSELGIVRKHVDELVADETARRNWSRPASAAPWPRCRTAAGPCAQSSGPC